MRLGPAKLLNTNAAKGEPVMQRTIVVECKNGNLLTARCVAREQCIGRGGGGRGGGEGEREGGGD